MSNVLAGLEPKEVFKYFEEISNIPRCSGNEREISDYLVSFAKKHNLEVIQDEALNIIIKKPGTPGYEKAQTIILQGHMDMVCEKNKDTIHDFETEGIKLRVEGDLIKGTGTTLGADNGIAVAFCLAILESNEIAHPPLEVLITTEEETGMGGAFSLNPENLSGKTLINIDSEEEGTLLVSCAGGVRSKVNIPILWESVGKNLLAYTIKIRGLRGGHSGMEIDKGRGNSNKLIGRTLNKLMSTLDFSLVDISGGAKMNAIPREADAVILIDGKDKENLEIDIREMNRIFKNELKASDPDVTVDMEFVNETYEKAFSKETLNKVVSALVLIPNGVQTMSMNIEGLVESSTNLGVLSTTESTVILESAIRSSVRSLKDNILNQTIKLGEIIGAEVVGEGSYPEWEYKTDSYIRKVFIDAYKDIHGNEPIVTAIHAGLECGLFKEKLGDIDMISFGPNMHDVHTPDENLSISSTERTWKYLLHALKLIK